MEYEDKVISCRECEKEFTWSAGEQKFYSERGLSQPGKCKECRQAKRAGQGNSGPRQMYDIICKECQKPGQVPFEPQSDDVLCRECFSKSRE